MRIDRRCGRSPDNIGAHERWAQICAAGEGWHTRISMESQSPAQRSQSGLAPLQRDGSATGAQGGQPVRVRDGCVVSPSSDDLLSVRSDRPPRSRPNTLLTPRMSHRGIVCPTKSGAPQRDAGTNEKSTGIIRRQGPCMLDPQARVDHAGLCVISPLLALSCCFAAHASTRYFCPHGPLRVHTCDSPRRGRDFSTPYPRCAGQVASLLEIAAYIRARSCTPCNVPLTDDRGRIATAYEAV